MCFKAFPLSLCFIHCHICYILLIIQLCFIRFNERANSVTQYALNLITESMLVLVFLMHIMKKSRPTYLFNLANGGRECLFNDALNTFYLRLYDVKHMVRDHSDSERGNPLPPHRQQGFFYMHHPTDRIIHTTAFVTPVVEHWLVREIAQWVHPMNDRSDDPSHHERTRLPRSYISLQLGKMAEMVLQQISFH